MVRFIEGLLVGAAGAIVGIEKIIDTMQYVISKLA